MKTLVKILIGFALGVLVTFGAIYSINNFQVTEKGETAITNTVIKSALNDASELTTEEYRFSNIGKFSQEGYKFLGDITIPFTGKSFAISYEGAIKVGIKDISTASVEINEVATTISVTLPDVEILDAYLDSGSYQTIDQSFNPFNQISTEEVTQLLASELDAAKEDAKSNGTFDKARKHAEQVVSSFVKALVVNTDYANYQVKIIWKTA